jgi:hypothetical protein
MGIENPRLSPYAKFNLFFDPFPFFHQVVWRVPLPAKGTDETGIHQPICKTPVY